MRLRTPRRDPHFSCSYFKRRHHHVCLKPGYRNSRIVFSYLLNPDFEFVWIPVPSRTFLLLHHHCHQVSLFNNKSTLFFKRTPEDKSSHKMAVISNGSKESQAAQKSLQQTEKQNLKCTYQRETSQRSGFLENLKSKFAFLLHQTEVKSSRC